MTTRADRPSPLALAARAGLLLALALVLAAAWQPATSRADVSWLCHPGTSAADDPCEIGLDTTRIAPDGSRSTSTTARPAQRRRPVDCFYVYPTVSNQVALNATKAKDPEIRSIARFQAARFSAGCRVFAPAYRQATVPGILGNGIGPVAEVAYSDVAEAFRRYLARDNGGRGFVLIGHSQGTLMLRALIRRVVDRDPALRRRLVGAFLLGGNVTTRAGSTTGGDFRDVPTCTRAGQDGCVVAYSTSSTDPEPVNFFGNTNTDILGAGLGLPSGNGFQVACTDPGPLSGDASPVSLLVPSVPFAPGFIRSAIDVTANGEVPTAATTWVEAFRYRGGCRTINGANVFRYAPVDGSRPLNEFPPAWGTHLVDLNLGVQRLTTIARRQAQTWLAARFAVGAITADRRRGTASAPATVPSAGTVTVTGSRLRRRVVDTSSPSSAPLAFVPRSRTVRSLRRRGAVRVRARVTFAAAGQEPIVRTVALRLVRPRARR